MLLQRTAFYCMRLISCWQVPKRSRQLFIFLDKYEEVAGMILVIVRKYEVTDFLVIKVIEAGNFYFHGKCNGNLR